MIALAYFTPPVRHQIDAAESATVALPADIARFLSRVEPQRDGCCWLWTAASDRHGYGYFWVDGKASRAHRWAYSVWNGPLLPGLVIHHLCYRPGCVNPAHLRQVTRAANTLDHDSAATSAINLRKTHCIHGHEFTPENTYVSVDGSRGGNEHRHCRICRRERKLAPAPVPQHHAVERHGADGTFRPPSAPTIEVRP